MHEVADDGEDIVREFGVEGYSSPPVRLLVDARHNVGIPLHHLVELGAPTLGETDEEDSWNTDQGFGDFGFLVLLVFHHEELTHGVGGFTVGERATLVPQQFLDLLGDVDVHVPTGVAKVGVKLRRRGDDGTECVDETGHVSRGVNGVVYSEIFRLYQTAVAGVSAVVSTVTE